MLLLILFGAIIVLCLIIWFICYSNDNEGVFFVCLGALSAVCLFFVGIGAIFTQCFKEVDYQETLQEKTILEYRLQEKDENLITSTPLYEDILKFNQKLLKHKTYKDNLWLNLFHNEKIATIDYIQLPKKE